ncbi:UNVERIFIED_CONTAM: hypothetical protein HDU68_001931 [Siphonaria sp. JEL0065]|nr:hypothetical protein HDU68_001931 [Siphonaria sp. JEL0065]
MGNNNYNPAPGHLKLVTDPDGKSKGLVLRVIYTAGVGSKTGVTFAGHPGPKSYAKYTRMSLAYDVWFPKGFDFVREGKLPGLWGQLPTSKYFDCGSSYNAVNGSHGPCWSVRALWRSPDITNGTIGLGAAYVYAPPNNV